MMGGREGMIVTSLFRYMWTELELKIAVHALSQIWPTESREPAAHFGIGCDFDATELSWGSGRFAVAIEVMM